jgi:ribosomal protein L11
MAIPSAAIGKKLIATGVNVHASHFCRRHHHATKSE